MAYCTQQDIINLELTEKELIQLTDDPGLGTVTALQVAAAIAKADAEIDAWCQDAYTVPFGPASEVLGTDGKNYTCIVPHTSEALNKPVTGANWSTYWVQKGSSGGAWATSTAYTALPYIITAWSATLAAFNLHRNRAKPTTLIDRYNKVMSWLKDVAQGKATLPGVSSGSLTSFPGSTTDGADQTFIRESKLAASVVLGSDGKAYTCIVDHTAAAANKPVTGGTYASYWEEGGINGSEWTSGSAYKAAGTTFARVGTTEVW